MDCKRAQKEALAAAAMAAGGESEEVPVGPIDLAVERVNGAGCDHCAAATPEAELLVCTGCSQGRYCSLACQHGAWFVGLC